MALLLRILPAPSDWKGQNEVISQLSGYPYYKKIEAAGVGYQAFLNRKLGIVKESETNIKKVESEEEANLREEEEKLQQKKHKKALDEGTDDPYVIMGLDHLRWRATDEDIKTAFRKLVLLYHPDKIKASKSQDTKEEDDALFKRISKANDTLTDLKKRRAYDSTDEFDDSFPSQIEKGKTFYETFAPHFLRFSRWSLNQPAPLLGDDNTSDKDLTKFYEFWYSFKSWRDYSFNDEYDEKEAETREEKRWMEKQNERERKRYKKEETSRIFKLTETAEKYDPRIIKKKEAALNEKNKVKNAKAEEKRIRLEEAAAKAAEEKERKEREEKAKQEEALRLSNQKKNENKKKSKLRGKLRTFVKANPTFNFLDEDIESLCIKLTIPKFENLNALFIGDVETARQAIEEEIAMMKEDAKEKSVATKEAEKEVKPWTEEEVSMLSKAMHKYPGGAQHRWEQIAEFIGTRTVKEIIAKSKEGKQIPSKPTMLYQVEDAYERFNKVKKPAVEIKAQASTREDDSKTTQQKQEGSVSPRKEEIKKEMKESNEKAPLNVATNTTEVKEAVVEWSSEEQKLLEKALTAHPASLTDRWDRISKDVGKPKKDCILRYKYLVSKIKEKAVAK